MKRSIKMLSLLQNRYFTHPKLWFSGQINPSSFSHSLLIERCMRPSELLPLCVPDFLSPSHIPQRQHPASHIQPCCHQVQTPPSIHCSTSGKKTQTKLLFQPHNWSPFLILLFIYRTGKAKKPSLTQTNPRLQKDTKDGRGFACKALSSSLIFYHQGTPKHHVGFWLQDYIPK